MRGTKLAVIVTALTVLLICVIGLTLGLMGGLWITPISLWVGFVCASLLPAVFGVLVAWPVGLRVYRWLAPSEPLNHGQTKGNEGEIENV